MAQRKSTPPVILQGEDVDRLIKTIQAGFDALNARLDRLEGKAPVQSHAEAQRKRELARETLKRSATRPAPARSRTKAS